MSSRSSRKVLWLAIGSIVIASGVIAGPRLWLEISTIPEPKPERFDLTDSVRRGPSGKVRVLRWGDSAGKRHGPFIGRGMLPGAMVLATSPLRYSS